MKTFNAVLQPLLENGTITWTNDYAEPGYTAGKRGILFANWNGVSHWDAEQHKSVTTDNTMPRLSELAERAGYSIEWSDEWTTCDDCGKALRTSPDSYGWTASYYEHSEEGGVCCRECVDADCYLADLSGDADRAALPGFPHPAEHGYVRLNADSYESGLHPGQSDSPKVVAKSLRAKGVTDFVFRVDNVGQFDSQWSVYVRPEDYARLEPESVPSALPYDPGTELGKALRGEPTPHYTVTTRTITPEQFIKGDWRSE